MLSLSFKDKVTDEQDEHLFKKFIGFPMKYEHDLSSDVDTKVSIWIGNHELAQQKSDSLKSEGFEFTCQIQNGEPYFLDDFSLGKKETISENVENAPEIGYDDPCSTPIIETKPVIMRPNNNTNHNQHVSAPVTPQLPPRYVTVEQFEELSKKAQDQLNAFSMTLMSRVEALSQSAAISAGLRHDHTGYSAHSAPTTSNRPPATSVRTAEFTAKNELIANGIRCEKCNKVIKGMEPITKLIMAVREHVIEHFDREQPTLKRFECRECPDFKTNFVDDFEKHLKKHGSMTSLPIKRQQLCVNLTSTTHLEMITELCNICFPEVFETTPPAINTIHAVDTPIRAKMSVFPHLDRLYCSKFNIPYASRGNQPVIRLE